MAPDDRERTFDKALARHLRPNAPREADALHPDAEILAAYHERLLAPEQMIFWKEHIARCVRCQEILAHLEASDELPVEAGQEQRKAQNVLTLPERGRPELAHVAAQAPMPAAEPQTTAAARWSRRLKVRPGANWRWLAPAGALAAGLLLWVSFHEANPPQFELAKNQQPAAPSPPASMPQLAAPSDKEADSKTVPSPSGDARAGAGPESGAFARNKHGKFDEKKSAPMREEKVQAERVQGDKAQADKSSASRVDLSPKQPSAPPDRDGERYSAAAGAVADEKALKQQGPPSVLSAPPPPEIKDRPVENLDVLTQSAKSEALPKAKSVAGATGRQAPQEQQSANVVAELRESSASRTAKSRAFLTVTTPSVTALWRIAPAGIIQRSTDAGSTWTMQTSGVISDLIAASAPADQVCWIVGRAGTILRTTDGGAHWQKVPAPTRDDLAAVFAVDAQQATVTSASIHKTYKTIDAGQSWTPVSDP